MVTNEKIRAFIAIPLRAEVVAGLKIAQETLRDTGITASFPRVSSLHITLKFLGDITGNQAGAIQQCLDQRISGFTPFDIDVQGLGAFPSVSRPRVAWAGLEAGDRLLNLQKLIEKEMKGLGFEPERKKYSPHITLARIKSSRNLDKLRALLETMKDFHMGTNQVGSIHLYRSILRPEGAVYQLLAEAKAGRNDRF